MGRPQDLDAELQDFYCRCCNDIKTHARIKGRLYGCLACQRRTLEPKCGDSQEGFKPKTLHGNKGLGRRGISYNGRL